MAAIYTTEIQKLYVAYFNRPADTAGLAYWEQALPGVNGDTRIVSDAFAKSLEYTSNYNGLTPVEVINKIYVNLFGRDAEADGLKYWSDLLAKGTLSIDTIVKNVSDAALTTDKTAYTNKVQAATAFTNALDLPFEAEGYRGTAAAVAAQAYIAKVSTDSSLADAIDTSYLNATVLAVVAAGKLDPVHGLRLQTDSIVGGEGADSFIADRTGSANTFQSGDRIGGGAGIDRLHVDVVSTGTPIAARTSGVERVEVHALAPATPAASTSPLKNLIDAAGMAGMTYWESQRSSADVTIENITLQNSQATKDVTIAMVETDAGNIDMGAFFAPAALRSAANSSAVLHLQAMDQRNAFTGVPLLEAPFTGFAFYLNGVLTKVESPAINTALSYESLFQAIKAAVAAHPALGNVTVTLGGSFTVNDQNGIARTGTEILLASSKDVIEVKGAESAWLLDPAAPAGNYYSALSTLESATLGHATATIILDDVGRGGLGGDLVVGSAALPGTLAAGYAYGVERFEIEVRDNSKLQTITSTNNTLREVVFTNGVTSSHIEADPTRVKDKGDLSVMGISGAVVIGTDSEPLQNASFQHGDFGLSDMRLIDASAMTGKISFDAQITLNTVAKYNAAPTDFTNIIYSGGANDDNISVSLHGSVLASGVVFPQTGGSFTFTANGGAGNDNITIDVVEGRAAGASSLIINAGDGNDIVTVSGVADSIVNLGAGNDVFYAPGTANDLVVTGGLGDDWIVLSTAVGDTVATSSNARMLFGAGEFGNDKVQNFTAGNSTGYDQFDFSALGGRASAFAGAAVSNSAGAITIQLETTANDTMAEIAALYTPGAAASSHLFIAYNAANLGKVYTVVDGGTGVAPVVTFVGSVDLMTVAWDGVTAVNFV